MINKKDIDAFINGEIRIEMHGNIYEYIGTNSGKLVLSDVNDGYAVRMSEKELIKDPDIYTNIKEKTLCS